MSGRLTIGATYGRHLANTNSIRPYIIATCQCGPVHHATSGIILAIRLRMVYTASLSYNQRLYSTSEVRSFYVLARSDTISIVRSVYVAHLNLNLATRNSRLEEKKASTWSRVNSCSGTNQP